jgi:hypothetical protein
MMRPVALSPKWNYSEEETAEALGVCIECFCGQKRRGVAVIRG